MAQGNQWNSAMLSELTRLNSTHLDSVRNEKVCESESYAYQPERDRDIVDVQFEELFQPFKRVYHEIERERRQDDHNRGQQEIRIDRPPMRVTRRKYDGKRDVLENAHGEDSVVVLALEGALVSFSSGVLPVPRVGVEDES